jgi:hypothetical protein
VKTALALLYATAAAVLAAIALAFACEKLSPPVAAALLAFGAVVGGFSLRTTPREAWRIDPVGGLALLAFVLFALRSFLWLVFEAGDGLWVFSPNNLGDFALHLTYVRQLVGGASFWPDNPIFSGAPLTYPLGVDLLNALLVLAGMDDLRAFIWVGLVASFVTLAALWRWGRGFAVAGFLFAGGLWGFAIFTRGVLVDYQSDAAWSEGTVVAWKSLPLALFVTQRGLLYAIPAGLVLLASWRARFLEPERGAQRLPLWGEVLLYAAMPVFHLHTFLVLSVLAAWWFLALAAARRHLATVVALALVPATVLVWQVTGGFRGEGMIALHPGWMQGEQNFFVFWLLNFGALPLLVAALLWRIAQSRDSRAGLLVLPAVAVFLACCVVRFSPWEWDNTKLMLWSYLLVLPPLWQVLLAPRPEWQRAVACFILFFSGAVSLAGGLTGHLVVDSAAARLERGEPAIGYQLATRSEIIGVRQAVHDIPMAARFVAHPTYNHPLLLCGRVLTMGYEGHVHSHGIDYAARLDAVKKILNGEEDWREQAATLGAQWLFWGREEAANYADSPQPWRGACRIQASGEWGVLYDLRPAEVPPAR